MQNKKQTILQDLKWFISDGLDNYDESIKISEIWIKINKLFEKEKEQIKDAYNQGYRDGEIQEYNSENDVSEFDDAENYYNNTFKND